VTAAPRPPSPASPGSWRVARKATVAPGRGPSEREEASRAEADEASAGRRTLGARLALAKDRRLVVEVTVEDGALDWAPGGEVTVTLDDGTRVTARVVEAATTAPGRLADGAVLRLVLELDGLLPAGVAPAELEVAGGLTLVVREGP
jgi:hypothetical protein